MHLLGVKCHREFPKINKLTSKIRIIPSLLPVKRRLVLDSFTHRADVIRVFFEFKLEKEDMRSDVSALYTDILFELHATNAGSYGWKHRRDVERAPLLLSTDTCSK